MKSLFTERHNLGRPRVAEVLNDAARAGLLTLVEKLVEDEWFGHAFPDRCGDGYAYAGTSRQRLKDTVAGYGLVWPPDVDRAAPPDDSQMFDLLEYCYEIAAYPESSSYHSYMGHHHYTYDQDRGRDAFAAQVNRVFERNGIAFELRGGEVVRLAGVVLHDALAQAEFRTSDVHLDALLAAATQKFLHRDVTVRKESLEKLWDAWERLKTVEPGKDKRASAGALINKASSEPAFRDRLDREARELTDIGNAFMIRHTETDKVPIAESEHIDYLFHRLFALIRLLVRTSGRGA